MKLRLQYFGGRGSGGGKASGGAWPFSNTTKISDISYEDAERLFNAPVGTKITMDTHGGDYVGEYTRTESGWKGSQQYKSMYVTPPEVKNEKGLAMQIVGHDIKFLKKGK